MIFAKKIESVTFDDLRGLVDARYREDARVDYKRDLPDLDGKRSNDAKRELLKDVAAFANGGGGDIIFGVDEDRDAQGKPNGVPLDLPGVDVANLDALERRWLEIAEYGLDPRIAPKTRLRGVDVPGSTRKLVILRVPRSLAAPHMVRETGWFPARRGPQTLAMTTAEIRAAFELSEGWAAGVRRFRDERLARLVSEDRPIAVVGSAHLVVHVVPFSIGPSGTRVDLNALKLRSPSPVRSQVSGIMTQFNADGLLTATDEHKGAAYAYSQFFRNGSVEFVVPIEAATRPGNIFLQDVEERAIQAASTLVASVADAGALYPFAITLSLIGVRGMRAFWGQYSDGPHPPYPRDLLCLDDAVLDEAADAGACGMLLRPVFDQLWQAFGHDRSPSFGTGVWGRIK